MTAQAAEPSDRSETAAEQGASHAAAPRARGLYAAWARLRDRLLLSPRFHRLAAAFPPTRPIVNARARALFDVIAGFVYSQTLLACVQLGVLERLRDGPRTASALAGACGLSPEAAGRLLDAAAALDLVDRRGRDDAGAVLFGLGGQGATVLAVPGLSEMIAHHALLYRDLADPAALLRADTPRTELADFWAYAPSERPETLARGDVDAYSALMAATQSFIAEEVLAAYPIARHRRLLDMGGGDGAFLRAAASVAPDLRLVLFDLPPVAERAAGLFEAAGLGERADTVGGSFFDATPPPQGADLVSLVRVLYDHDDAAAAAILAKARAALPAGGTLLVAEPMAETPGAAAVGAAYFGFYLLAMRGGRPRTPADLGAMIEAAGFSRPRLVRTRRPLLTRALVAKAV